jgi:chemosensory pili system protein ChpA (sensor histidine kinase/response regulator)
MMLEDLECQVIRTYDGGEALEKLKETVPNLIILDIILDEVMGYTFFEKMKQEARYADIPVIIVTVLLERDCQDLVEMDPRTIVLEKPFKKGHLLEAVERGLKPGEGYSEKRET